MLLGSEWQPELDKCKAIFIRVPSYNRSVLISTSNSRPAGQSQTSGATYTPNTAPFHKSDSRLRHIPFMTFRPTFHEVSAHFLLSKLEHFNNAYLTFTSRFEAKINESQNQNEKKSKKTKTKAADKKKSQVQAKVQSEYDNFYLLLEIYLN